ncbi:hypothetical protein [Streptomyces sp. NPDC054874]
MPEPDLDVTLTSRHQPALAAGTYTLAATQTVAGPNSNNPAPTALAAKEQQLHITAPRFALGPNEVLACHPPPGMAADFSLTLPHLAAADPLLPWSRTVLGAETPWLVLLTVTDAEVRLGKDAVCTARTAADLVTAQPGILLPRFASEKPSATDRTPLLTADVAYPSLKGLLPAKEELGWLAHARTVTEAKQRQPGWEPGRCSVLVGNRMPTAAGRYTVLLLSLEGFETFDFLGGPTAVAPTTTAVRMVVLHSWSFTHAPSDEPAPAAGFHALAQSLAASSTRENLLRLPSSELGHSVADEHVRRRFEAGYVPVAQRLPTGEVLPAWYRGPFTPHPVPPLPGGQHYPDADSHLIFLREQGMFDLSYACAFSLGKLMALADPTWLRGLERVRAHGLAALHRLLRGIPAPEPGCDSPPEPEEVTAGVREQFSKLVGTGGLAQRITEGLNKKAPPPHRMGPRQTSAPGPGPGAAQVVAALTGTGQGNDEADRMAVRLRPLLAEIVVTEAAQMAAGAGDTAAQLARLPLDHLVPHEAMLPQHGARFFHIDPQWWAVFRRGTLDTGAATAMDVHLDALLAQELDESAPAAGMLLRSPLVTAWPELVVEATPPGGGTPVRVPVFHPQPDVLLVLFASSPGRVTVREPARGLSLGIDSPRDSGTIVLRAPAAGPKQLGQSLDAPYATKVWECRREAGTGVLHIHHSSRPCLTQLLQKALKDHGYTQQLTPASFALQLINGAGQLVFTPSSL